MALRFRRGVNSDFTLQGNPRRFAEGEPVYNTTNNTLHIGRGTDEDPVNINGISAFFFETTADGQRNFTVAHDPDKQEAVDVVVNGIFIPPSVIGGVAGSGPSDGWISVNDGAIISLPPTMNIVIGDNVFIRVRG